MGDLHGRRCAGKYTRASRQKQQCEYARLTQQALQETLKDAVRHWRGRSQTNRVKGTMQPQMQQSQRKGPAWLVQVLWVAVQPQRCRRSRGGRCLGKRWTSTPDTKGTGVYKSFHMWSKECWFGSSRGSLQIQTRDTATRKERYAAIDVSTENYPPLHDNAAPPVIAQPVIAQPVIAQPVIAAALLSAAADAR